MIDENRPCAAHNRIDCPCLTQGLASRQELDAIRSQLNPQPIPAPSAPATSAAQPQEKSQ